MTPAEYKKYYETSRHFFLSELKGIDEPDLALVIELMRASEHIKNIQQMMLLVSPPTSDNEDDEIAQEIEFNSLRTMILNMTAAQLREALKIIWKFSDSPYFITIREKFNESDNKIIASLIKLNDEYETGKGFIREVLEPVRNLMFHYQTDQGGSGAIAWIKKIKELDSQKRPPYQTVNLDRFEFFPGLEYETQIYSSYLFFGKEGTDNGMKWQVLVWETQKLFLRATKAIVEAMLNQENISSREIDWAMKYFYGYRTE